MSDYFLHIIYHHKQDAGIVWNINQLKVDLIVGEKPRKGCEGSHDSLEGDDRLFHIAVKEEDRRSRETENEKLLVRLPLSQKLHSL